MPTVLAFEYFCLIDILTCLCMKLSHIHAIENLSLPTPHLSDLVNDYSMPTTAVNRILHMDLAVGTCPLHAAQ